MVIGGGVLLAVVGLTAVIGRSSSRQSQPPSAPSAPAANPRAGKNETKNAVVPPPPVKVEELPAASPKIVAQATQRIEKKAEAPSSFPEEILEIEGRRIAVAKRLLCWQSREDLAALREHVAIPGMTWERFFREFGWQAFSGPSGRWLGNDKLVPYIDSSGDKNTLFCVSYDLAPSLIRGTKLWGGADCDLLGVRPIDYAAREFALYVQKGDKVCPPNFARSGNY